MTALFESGRIVDLILGLMVAEALAVCALALWGRFRVPVAGLLFNLAAGACLLLALRAVLMDSGWFTAGMWLLLALFAHLGDLLQRFAR